LEYRIDPKEFDIKFMRENGFVRRRCRRCGSFFWTQNPDQELCGEAPCVDYTFFDSPPTRRSYSIGELRREFLKFFEENGHTIIDPYPVVARWRDDLLITIASIADFQPHVTSGASSPPANPLVVSQPCLRFEDIDRVGYTSGRHMTIFEMGGAHAFNDRRRGVEIYWKDETIEYHHLFATERLGIPSEMITYKEHFWVGGGNAGPDVEGIVAGLEVSTLVFMRYRIDEEGRLHDIPIWTVDTGYGIERWTWLSQGSYSAFEAIYGEINDWLLDTLDIKVDRDDLRRFALVSPNLKEEDLPRLADILEGVGLGDKEVLIRRLIYAYKLLDHSKAAIFLISDGGVPSNVREGYLTRMLLRRIFRVLDELGMDYEVVYKLFEKQVGYWGRDFPRVAEAGRIIPEILDIEIRKYREILRNVPKYVRQLMKRGRKPGIEMLIELYDSYGVHPDYVKDYLKREYGVSVEVPHNFTELVAKKHLERSVGKRVEKKYELPELPRTTKLFYTNQYLGRADARVLWTSGNKLVLDRTIFYPTGGGQVHDTGVIRGQSGEVRVVDVQDVDGVVLHILDKESPFKPGDEVELEIDWPRRYRIMKHHTSTHILLSAARRALGPHIWQTGVVKQPDYAHLDITHYRSLTSEEIRRLEDMVNRIIREGRVVQASYMDRGEAERRYGVTIYQGGVVPGEKLRIVTVEDWDVEACGGTHVRNTSEIALFKILGVEKIQDGVLRLQYVAGEAAIERLEKGYEVLKRVSTMLSTSPEETPRRVEELLNEVEGLDKRYRELREELVRWVSDSLARQAEEVDGYRLAVFSYDDVDTLIKVGEHLTETNPDILFVGVAGTGRGVNIVVRIGSNLVGVVEPRRIAEAIGDRCLEKYGGKGGERYYRIGGVMGCRDKDINQAIREIIYDVSGEGKVSSRGVSEEGS